MDDNSWAMAIPARRLGAKNPMNTVTLATDDKEFGQVPADKAKAEAQALANEQGKPVTLRDPVTDKLLGKAKPAKKAPVKAKGKPAKKAAKKPAAKAKPAAKSKPVAAPKTPKTKAPRGMVVEILKLASRAKGVSPAELNELTEWKGAPWKWLFSNPKKNGYCDRWGYKFTVLQTDDGVRYQVVKK
ncbi:hypothetical protein [Bradyrhizobium neotropicale]|uniref:hypothetical protein n=1 Tax=Bradyrhizobium neotropicale TaxID=1497615 RepID=UPI001AD73877|nr:hypothetical protein [Bradyrhizobium neotropicale]